MFSISLLFVVIPAMSMDVSYAGGTPEIWDGAQKKLIFFRPAPWFLSVLASALNCIFWRAFSVRKPGVEAGPAAWRSWIFNSLLFCPRQWLFIMGAVAWAAHAAVLHLGWEESANWRDTCSRGSGAGGSSALLPRAGALLASTLCRVPRLFSAPAFVFQMQVWIEACVLLGCFWGAVSLLLSQQPDVCWGLGSCLMRRSWWSFRFSLGGLHPEYAAPVRVTVAF